MAADALRAAARAREIRAGHMRRAALATQDVAVCIHELLEERRVGRDVVLVDGAARLDRGFAQQDRRIPARRERPGERGVEADAHAACDGRRIRYRRIHRPVGKDIQAVEAEGAPPLDELVEARERQIGCRLVAGGPEDRRQAARHECRRVELEGARQIDDRPPAATPVRPDRVDAEVARAADIESARDAAVGERAG